MRKPISERPFAAAAITRHTKTITTPRMMLTIKFRLYQNVYQNVLDLQLFPTVYIPKSTFSFDICKVQQLIFQQFSLTWLGFFLQSRHHFLRIYVQKNISVINGFIVFDTFIFTLVIVKKNVEILLEKISFNSNF